MSNHRYLANSEEILFQLDDILKVNVWNYAPAFQDWKEGECMETLLRGIDFAEQTLSPANRSGDEAGVSFHDGVVSPPDSFRKAWELSVAGGWLGRATHSSGITKVFPHSIHIALQEAFAASNPALFRMLVLTDYVHALIQRHGTENQKSLYGPKLASGQWSATIAIAESPVTGGVETVDTSAKWNLGQEPGLASAYFLSGTKIQVVAGEHDLTENILHLVLAKISGTVDYGLFLVPKARLVDGELIENNLSIDNLHLTIGNHAIPNCSISYGREGKCYGELLLILHDEDAEALRYLEPLRLGVAVSSLGLASAGFHQAISLRQQGRIHFEDPIATDRMIRCQAILEGLRGAIYSTAFYADCQAHGAEPLRQNYSDLVEILTTILKVYATDRATEVLQIIMQLFGEGSYADDYPFEQQLRDLASNALVAGTNSQLAQEFIHRILPKNDGRLFQALAGQINEQEMHSAKSEFLKEAIGIFRDFYGGLILIASEFNQEESEGSEGEEHSVNKLGYTLQADRILKLFGDVLVTFHLIRQGLEAERYLIKEGVNFHNLRREAIQKPLLRKWYNKLVLAEYFATNILAEQEGVIAIIQRNSGIATEALFEAELFSEGE